MTDLSTPFYAQHIIAGANIVDFHGWQMPLHYGSQLNEHFAVRNDVGVFDVSHMGIIDVCGPDAQSFLRYVLANDVAKLSINNRALYSCMLNEKGGIIDDLIVYRLQSDLFRLVVNASRRQQDWQHLNELATKYNVNLSWRNDLALFALQGPNARSLLQQMLPQQYNELERIKPFQLLTTQEGCLACTGYTGEDGFEIMATHADATAWWQRFRDAGVQPCGLGARDTLRLEAGLNLYGQDMDETTSPYEVNLGWTVAWAEPRNFNGRDALMHWREYAPTTVLIGLVSKAGGVLRQGQKVFIDNKQIGTITSGGYAPSLKESIALARVAMPLTATVSVERRGRLQDAATVHLPFVRNGKSIYKSIGEAYGKLP
jgi:aminomethyltransferase